MEKILVTGATGRVGANLINELTKEDFKIRAFVMPNDPKIAKLKALDIEIVYGDLTNPDEVSKAVEGVDTIIHLAALMSIMAPGARRITRSYFFDVNVKGNFYLLEAARKHLTDIERLVFASTDATYSPMNPKYTPIDENHPQDPINLYGLTKVLGERICFEYLSEWKLPVTVLRFGSIMACDEILNFLKLDMWADLLKFAKSHDTNIWILFEDVEKPWEILENLTTKEEKLVIITDEKGRPWKFHFTDVRDTIQGITLALKKDIAVGETFNILGPAPCTLDEAVRYASKLTGTPYVKGVLPTYWGFEIDISKAKGMLGYRPQYDIFKMIDEAVAFRKGTDIGVIST